MIKKVKFKDQEYVDMDEGMYYDYKYNIITLIENKKVHTHTFKPDNSVVYLKTPIPYYDVTIGDAYEETETFRQTTISDIPDTIIYLGEL